MTLDLDQLEATAEATHATGVGWYTARSLIQWAGDEEFAETPDAAFIEAASPQTVLALVERVRRLEAVTAAARAVTLIEDLYRDLDVPSRKFFLDGFEAKHREAMDALRAALAVVDAPEPEGDKT